MKRLTSNIRIESDGTPQGTKVFTTAGERLKGIRRVEWSVEAGKLAIAKIEARLVEVTAVGKTVRSFKEIG